MSLNPSRKRRVGQGAVYLTSFKLDAAPHAKNSNPKIKHSGFGLMSQFRRKRTAKLPLISFSTFEIKAFNFAFLSSFDSEPFTMMLHKL